MQIRLDDLSGPEIAAFLEEHIQDMRSVSPPESKHALDLAALKAPSIRFWTMWQDDLLIGCGALKTLSHDHVELKSMRIRTSHRGLGYSTELLHFLLDQARWQGAERISLETGSMPFFAPARALYRRHGFIDCAPFGAYKPDPNSVFMTRLVVKAQRTA